MRYLKLFFLLLPLQLINAQTDNNIYCGIAIGSNLMFEDNNLSNHYEILPPPDIYIHAGYSFSRELNIELSAGYISLADNWNGIDCGVSLKSYVSDKFFTSFGINYNTVSGGGGEGNLSPLYYKKNFISGSFGAGYFVIPNAYVELNYLVPLSSNKLYGYDKNTNEVLRLNGRLKLSFGWNFYL
jgi:hypothetical protein